MDGKDGVFISPSKGLVSTKEMINLISSFVKEEPGSFYRLVIGTDSQSKRSNGESETDFVSAVVVHRQGKGARYFWKKTKTNRIPVLREKIYTETQISLALAEEIVPMIRECVKPSRYDLEIHIDVGSLGPTREMIREVVGMVNGNGYTAKTKPESWGASCVADKHT